MSEAPKRPTPGRPAARPVAKKPVEAKKAEAKKDSATPTPEGKGGNGKKGILIGIVVVLLIINGVQFFIGEKKKKELNAEIVQRDSSIASMEADIAEMEADLKKQIERIEQLNGDKTSLEQQLAELETKKEELRRSFNWSNSERKKLANQLAGHKTLLLQRDEKIKQLEDRVALLDSTNKEQAATIQSKIDEISSLSVVKEDLEGKVEDAQVLIAGNFEYQPYKKNDKVIKPLQPFKGKSIAKLNIAFKLMPNAVAMVETKTVYLQIMDPKGNIINLDGSGTFETADGAQTYYTLQSDEMYQREGTYVNFEFINSNDYEAGPYSVNVYVEGNLIGKSSFTVK